jgi:hypothetical protein
MASSTAAGLSRVAGEGPDTQEIPVQIHNGELSQPVVRLLRAAVQTRDALAGQVEAGELGA